MYRNLFELQVMVGSKVIREYSHNGCVFVQANEGTQYTLRVKNNSHRRAMIVASVDGLDVLTGKPAEKAGSGYIVDAYDSIEIKGYRVTDNDVAAFLFSKGGDSYAASKGKESNNGVIGIRAIFEKQIEPPEIYSHFSNNQFNMVGSGIGGSSTTKRNRTLYGSEILSYGSLKSSSAGYGGGTMMSCSSPCRDHTEKIYDSFDLGTSFGGKVEDSVRKVEFQLGELAAEIELYYASRNALTNMGVDLNPKKKVTDTSMPRAFNDKWCAPPKGWRG